MDFRVPTLGDYYLNLNAWIYYILVQCTNGKTRHMGAFWTPRDVTAGTFAEMPKLFMQYTRS